MSIFGRRRPFVISVMSGKGGTGKTLTTCALSRGLSKIAPVTVLDFDLHGPNVLTQFGLPVLPGELDGMKIRPPHYTPTLSIYGADQMGGEADEGFLADDSMKRAWVTDAFESLDLGDSRYVICDLPAGTDEIFYQVIKKIPLDAIVIVTNPDAPALADATKVLHLLKSFKVLQKVVGVVENKAEFRCPSCGVSQRIENGHGGAREALCLPYHLPYLGAVPYLWYPPGSKAILDDPFFARLTERLLQARFKARRLRKWGQ